MPRALNLPVAVLALSLFSGCSAQQAMLSSPGELRLLPPAEGNAEVLLKQKVTMLAGQREQQFLTVARFDRRQLRLVVLLPSGQRLLTLDYDGVELRQQQDMAIDLPGEEILAIMQFAHWPEVSLRRHYAEADGWRVQVTPAERRLLTDSGLALSIDYRPRKWLIDNHQKNYRVIVETLEKTEL